MIISHLKCVTVDWSWSLFRMRLDSINGLGSKNRHQSFSSYLYFTSTAQFDQDTYQLLKQQLEVEGWDRALEDILKMAADCQPDQKQWWSINMTLTGSSTNLHIADLCVNWEVLLWYSKLHKHSIVVSSAELSPHRSKHLHGFNIHLRNPDNTKHFSYLVIKGTYIR